MKNNICTFDDNLTNKNQCFANFIKNWDIKNIYVVANITITKRT